MIIDGLKMGKLKLGSRRWPTKEDKIRIKKLQNIGDEK
jgi:hypothetical protein